MCVSHAGLVSLMCSHARYLSPGLRSCCWQCDKAQKEKNEASHSCLMQMHVPCRSHLILRNLRPQGSKEYVIPKGFAFNYITCANYTFEIYGWILFGVATQTVAAFAFIAAGSLPMTQWALAKHKRLRKVRSRSHVFWMNSHKSATVYLPAS